MVRIVKRLTAEERNRATGPQEETAREGEAQLVIPLDEQTADYAAVGSAKLYTSLLRSLISQNRIRGHVSRTGTIVKLLLNPVTSPVAAGRLHDFMLAAQEHADNISKRVPDSPRPVHYPFTPARHFLLVTHFDPEATKNAPGQKSGRTRVNTDTPVNREKIALLKQLGAGHLAESNSLFALSIGRIRERVELASQKGVAHLLRPSHLTGQYSLRRFNTVLLPRLEAKLYGNAG